MNAAPVKGSEGISCSDEEVFRHAEAPFRHVVATDQDTAVPFQEKDTPFHDPEAWLYT